MRGERARWGWPSTRRRAPRLPVVPGRQPEVVAVVKLYGGTDTPAISLEPRNFETGDGEALPWWGNVDLLSFRAYHDKGEKLLGSKGWVVPQPVFRKVWWDGGK